MMKLGPTGAVTLLLAVASARPALPEAVQPKVAVSKTIYGPAASDPAKYGLDAQEITRHLEEALRASNRFHLFERDPRMQQPILDEQDFAQSPRAAGNAAEFGKLNNVSYIVQPFISEFRFAPSFAEVDGLPGKYRRTDSGKLVVVFKVLDTTTGEIKYRITLDAGFSRPGGVLDAKAGGPSPDLWIKMVDEVTRKGSDEIANSLSPIKVARYEQGQLFINRGEGTGLKVGDVYALFAAGDDVKDPDTGQTLASAEFLIGKVKIVRVIPGVSVAQPVGELKQSPKPGDILRKE